MHDIVIKGGTILNGTGAPGITGGRRLVQHADGYRATLVAGTPTFENGEDTGAGPDRLVRAGR